MMQENACVLMDVSLSSLSRQGEKKGRRRKEKKKALDNGIVAISGWVKKRNKVKTQLTIFTEGENKTNNCKRQKKFYISMMRGESFKDNGLFYFRRKMNVKMTCERVKRLINM